MSRVSDLVRNITLADVEGAVTRDPQHLVRIQVVGGRVFAAPVALNAELRAAGWSCLRHCLAIIQDAVTAHRPADVDFVLNVADNTHAWPILSQHARLGDPASSAPFLVPFCARPGPRATDAREPPSAATWARMNGTALWRGANTGKQAILIGRWERNMRARLTVLSRLFPNHLDAAITAWPQRHANLSLLTPFLRAGKAVPFETFRRHKYVVDVDGNVQSDRFASLLGLGNLVLKATRFATAYTANVAEMPNVVHVAPDLSDLIEVISCLRQHDARAYTRARAGVAAARRLVSYEALVGYWGDLLEHYAAQQTFVPAKADGAVPASALLLLGRRTLPSNAPLAAVGGAAGGGRGGGRGGRGGVVPRRQMGAPGGGRLMTDVIQQTLGRPGRDAVSFVDLSGADAVGAAALCALPFAAWWLVRRRTNGR